MLGGEAMVSSDQRLALGGDQVFACCRVEDVEIWRRERGVVVLLVESDERIRSGTRLMKLSLRGRPMVDTDSFRGRYDAFG